MLIYGTQMDISKFSILCFLHGWDFEPLTNTTKIDLLIDEIRKVNLKQIGTKDKMVYYNGEHYYYPKERS